MEDDHAGALHHVELHAAALETAVGFWGWLLGELGYDRKHDWDGGRSWVRGPTYVVLADAERTDHPFDRRAPGLILPAVTISNGAAWRRGLRNHCRRISRVNLHVITAGSMNHLAFHAASRRQVDDVTAGVRERDDASVLFEDRHPFAGGYYALYCEGPEGVKVEVVGPDSG